MSVLKVEHPPETHYVDSHEMVVDHPNSPFPPSTFIDFASGDLRPRFAPTRPSPLSFHCKWLGGHHDGYPLTTTLDKYMQYRRTEHGPGTLEYAALIQSQLTFGLLEAVLRISIPESFLLSQATDGTTTLSTANLAILCRDLYHRAKVMHHPDKCLSWFKDVNVTLSDASRRVWVYSSDWSKNPFRAAVSHPEAFEDILRVLCTIGNSLENVLPVLPSKCKQGGTIFGLQFHRIPDIKPARDQLLAQGWCPLTIAALGMYGSVIIEYAKSFRPFLRHKGEHSRCTETACTVNNIDSTTYIQRHSSDECLCDCKPTIPPFHLVSSLLSSGRIPVVTLSDKGLTVRAANEVPYVAISHVWVDGLGSTTEEGLPTCQVSRITSIASSLVPGGAFWIDALCVPEQRNLRKRAIQFMAKTYADAAIVVVIDASIRNCSKHAPLEEKLLRIHISGWMQRLWTYQEAMLAERLCFEFAEGLVDLEELVPSLEDCGSTPLLFALSHALIRIRHHILGGASATDSLTLSEVALAVRWRTTSKLEDETFAMAGLLQIDIGELLNASSPDDRMKSLLIQKRTLNSDIIFTSAPKILGISGFSWAPRSLMSGPYPGNWSGNESAVCTPTGLLAEYASLVFSGPEELDEDALYVILDTTRSAQCSFLLHRVNLVRDKRRAFCNGMLIDRGIPTVIGSQWACVGVRMLDVEEGTFGERECHYHEISFNLHAIDISEASRQRSSGTQVIYAEWYPRMKVRVV